MLLGYIMLAFWGLSKNWICGEDLGTESMNFQAASSSDKVLFYHYVNRNWNNVFGHWGGQLLEMISNCLLKVKGSSEMMQENFEKVWKFTENFNGPEKSVLWIRPTDILFLMQ